MEMHPLLSLEDRMTQWFQQLSSEEQELVHSGWGSQEFANWMATFLLSMGSMALKRQLPPAERQRLNSLQAQRFVQQHRPGHKPDVVEHLYNRLHAQVAALVGQIDDHTGKHGATAVHWVDGQLQSLNKYVLDQYDRMRGTH
jgi:hypothetical protein